MISAVRLAGAPPRLVIRDGAPERPSVPQAAPKPPAKPKTPEAKIAKQAAKQVGKPKDPNPPKAEIRKILCETAERLGIPTEILMAIAFKESSWRHYAKDGSVLRGHWSPSDVGIMQISQKAHPAAFPRAGTDMRYNIEYGARYLEYQYERYGNWPDAIAAYNYGSARRNKKGKLVNQYYVDKVDTYVQFFKSASDGLPNL